jgi:hypothetical protein
VQVLRRHRAVGPWSCNQVLLQGIYLAVNDFCFGFNISTADQARVRAGQLSLINLTPTYLGPHLSFICDILGVSLSTHRLFHRSAAVISFLFALLHVIIDVAETSSLKNTKSWELYGVIVS